VLHYRRAPEHPFPAQIEDAVAAYKALLEKGFDAAKLSTAGDSAGGNLAIASVLKMRDLRLPLPGSVITFSPWLDMALRGATLGTNSATDALVGPGLLEAMVGVFLDGRRIPARSAGEPSRERLQELPAALHQRGGLRDVVERLRNPPRQGQSCRREHDSFGRAGHAHVFPALAGRAPEADEEMQRNARWYRAL
jgi:epsilon-lactone hydrolase